VGRDTAIDGYRLERRKAEMIVWVHETWNDRAPGEMNDLSVRPDHLGDFCGGACSDDLPFFEAHCFNTRSAFIHGQDVSAQQRFIQNPPVLSIFTHLRGKKPRRHDNVKSQWDVIQKIAASQGSTTYAEIREAAIHLLDSQNQPGPHYGFTNEAHFDLAEFDNVTIVEGHAADIPAIHIGPVGAAQVIETARATHYSDRRVAFADRPIIKLDA
jgi:hypothetical protein